MRSTKPRGRLEKHEQADGVRLLRSLGAAVYVLGTTRRSGDYQGTMQTPGIADVEAWLRCPQGTLTTMRLLKWEVKRAGGRLSPDQQAYRQLVEQSTVDYVCGDLNALIAWLIGAGYLRRDHVPHDRHPTAP
jgi:hypothetical protein